MLPRRRARNPLQSIHDPPDPSVGTLPNKAKAEWEQAYEKSFRAYERPPEDQVPDQKGLAKRAAWRTIKLTWKQTGSDTWRRCEGGACYWPAPMDAPDPLSVLVGLGVLIEVVYIDKVGKIHTKPFDKKHPPILWWDDKLKALFAMPKAPYPKCQAPDFSDPAIVEAANTYKRWHQRDAQCESKQALPDVELRAVGAADSVSYASDKWNDRDPDPRLVNAQKYIHNHWYDVWIWMDDAKSPNLVVIEGGELDLHERGLIH